MLCALQQALSAGKSGVALSSKPESSWLLEHHSTQGEPPPCRWGHTVSQVDGNSFLVHGGQGADGEPLGSAWTLDAEGMWTESLGSSTEPVQFHRCVEVEDLSLVLCFGGESSANDELKELDAAQCFDTSLELWYPAATTGSGPHARSGHAMACIHQNAGADLNQSGDSTGTQSMLRRVMQAGGISSTTTATPSSAAASTASYSSPAASACAEANLSTPTAADTSLDVANAGGAVGSVVLVHGGVRQGRFVNDVHVLEMSTYRWSKSRPTGSPPGPRAYHSLTPIGGGRVVLVGGSDDRQAFGDVHVLDTASHPWAWSEPCTTGNHPTARSGHTALRVSSRHILIAGGWNPNSAEPAPLADAFLLDVETWHWTPITESLMPRSLNPLQDSSTDVSRVGGGKRAAEGAVQAPAPAPKRRGTRAVATAVTTHQGPIDINFGVWATVARVGACAVLLGPESAAGAGDCGVLLHGGRNCAGKPTADTFLLPLPLPALQQRGFEAAALSKV